jgi:hypothetical protein
MVSSLLLNKRFFINLTPCIPLSKNGEGEDFFKRGAGAPLKHPAKLVSFKGREMKKRGAKPPS